MSPLPAIRHLHPALALALIGAASAIVEMLLDFEEAIHIMGLVFGAPVAFYLFSAHAVRWWRAALVLALSGASWEAAVHAGIRLVKIYDTNPYAVGAASGAIGAAILLIGLAVALPAFRRPGSWALPLATGTAFGAALLYPSLEGNLIALLLVGWQTGMGAVLGWGVRRG